jgi:D-amino-acid dehydrogenase
MRVAIVGAGIIGVTTAYELAADGHEVTVFERRSAAAEETSFANAGVVAPGYVTPWAAPGMPGKVARYLFSQHAPVKLALPLKGADLVWMWKWFRACKLETYLTNRARMQRLAFYSRDCLHDLTDRLQLDYDRSPGYMVLLRSEADSKLIQPGLQVLRDAGVAFSEISSDKARLVEPALNPDTQFMGAVHLPSDEVGNCRQFALLLKKEAEALGARFEFNANVAALDPSHPSTLAVQGEPAPRHFDALVMCAGLASASLLRPVGLKIPLAAVYGYSISAPIREPLNAPRSALMDERYKVAISRLGNRVRVAAARKLADGLMSSGLPPSRPCTRFFTTGFLAQRRYRTLAPACRNGRAHAPCCPTARRYWAQAACRVCGSTWAMAPAAGRCRCGSARAVADGLSRLMG